MAIKFFCENPDCGNYKKLTTEGKVRYQMREGHLVPEVKKCSYCGEVLSVEETIEVGVPQISIGKFAGMTSEQKASTLKKRAEIFNKKDDVKGRKKEIQERTIKKYFGQ